MLMGVTKWTVVTTQVRHILFSDLEGDDNGNKNGLMPLEAVDTIGHYL